MKSLFSNINIALSSIIAKCEERKSLPTVSKYSFAYCVKIFAAKLCILPNRIFFSNSQSELSTQLKRNHEARLER